MKAMILAAGRGERMKPLTDTCPKPLLKVRGKPLIEYHIERLADAGVRDIVINLAWLGEQIEGYLGDGRKWQVNISYSAEFSGALETAGGIVNALPLLGHEPFILVNGDVFTSFDFRQLTQLAPQQQGHLYLVDNPAHNSKGDFAIVEGMLTNLSDNKANQQGYTYSGIALFRPEFFHPLNKRDGVVPLGPLLRVAAKQQVLSASKLPGSWTDVGTPERLASLNEHSGW